jgi:RNA polymerase subunit RPABC4/transcription elongation factor Spt4
MNGDKNFLAVNAGNFKRDECGQKPFFFISGEWKDQVVMVDPEKMKFRYKVRMDDPPAFANPNNPFFQSAAISSTAGQ